MSGKRRSSRLGEKQKANSLDTETETPAALLNDVVLQTIFKYLGYKDLRACRNVKNTVWLRNSKKAWWSRTKVAFPENSGTGKVEDYFNQTGINTCVRNYKFEIFTTFECACARKKIWRENYKDLLKQFGHSIKYLELGYWFLTSAIQFRQHVSQNCPNLEHLVCWIYPEVCTCTDALEPMKWVDPHFWEQTSLKFLRVYFPRGIRPLTWMELLSHFPNLEALETMTSQDIYKVISIILQRDPKRLRLKHIEINGLNKIDFEESLRLVLLDSKLEFETIRIERGSCQPATLDNILNLHAKSLKELCLLGDGGASPIDLLLRQPLYNLEKLRFFHCLFTADIFRFTPNLRIVDVQYDKSYKLLKNAGSNLRIDTCKQLTLSIYGRRENSGDSDLQFFFSAFPNVEILQVYNLNNFGFSLICEHWTKLVSFTVSNGSQVDDFGLLGFNPNSKTKRVRHPNITNLKGLKVFSKDSRMFARNEWQVLQVEMKYGGVVLKELESLLHLQKFELKNYQLRNSKVWMKIFAKYPGN